MAGASILLLQPEQQPLLLPDGGDQPGGRRPGLPGGGRPLVQHRPRRLARHRTGQTWNIPKTSANFMDFFRKFFFLKESLWTPGVPGPPQLQPPPALLHLAGTTPGTLLALVHLQGNTTHILQAGKVCLLDSAKY